MQQLEAKKGNNKLGCIHYQRSCKIVSPCCNEIFWCRHCHNDAKFLNNSIIKNSHEIDRKAIVEIICAKCNERQGVSNVCIKCKIRFSKYFCSECKFWDDLGIEKKVFHCNDCGICRVGGRNNYFHCRKCGCCYENNIRFTHKCIENAMNSPCPICLDNLFESVKSVSVLTCGHMLHYECSLFLPYCPLCNSRLIIVKPNNDSSNIIDVDSEYSDEY